MCRNSVVNVVEIKKESISTTVTTCLRPYGNQALRIKIPNFFCFATKRAQAINCELIFCATLGFCDFGTFGLCVEVWIYSIGTNWNIQDGGYYEGVKFYYFVCFPRLFHNLSLLNWRKYLEITKTL